jgi:hypothetical protein
MIYLSVSHILNTKARRRPARIGRTFPLETKGAFEQMIHAKINVFAGKVEGMFMGESIVVWVEAGEYNGFPCRGEN